MVNHVHHVCRVHTEKLLTIMIVYLARQVNSQKVIELRVNTVRPKKNLTLLATNAKIVLP